eukprot:COSAG02_NODE_3795_length_6217_cov_4.382151_3_plen_177_part_00
MTCRKVHNVPGAESQYIAGKVMSKWVSAQPTKDKWCVRVPTRHSSSIFRPYPADYISIESARSGHFNAVKYVFSRAHSVPISQVTVLYSYSYSVPVWYRLGMRQYAPVPVRVELSSNEPSRLSGAFGIGLSVVQKWGTLRYKSSSSVGTARSGLWAELVTGEIDWVVKSSESIIFW